MYAVTQENLFILILLHSSPRFVNIPPEASEFVSLRHECLLLGTSVNIANHIQFGKNPFFLNCHLFCIVLPSV